MSFGLLEQVRTACKEVAERAKYVHINLDRIRSYAASLPVEHVRSLKLDPRYHYIGHPDDTIAYILTLDTINFGSGYSPHIHKRANLSDYFTIASALKDRFDTKGPFTPNELSNITVQECATVFGQDLDGGPRSELMGFFASALNELGQYILDRFRGQFVDLVLAANFSVEDLVQILSEMPYFKDVALYEDIKVPFYKRAQITSADLSMAFDGQGSGYFYNLDRLTIFADNAVPHVLRIDGLLRYEGSLAYRIDVGELILSGSAEEVEIRAVALHSVELLVEELRCMGHNLTSMMLDNLLWNRAHQPYYKERLPHRTRTIFY